MKIKFLLFIYLFIISHLGGETFGPQKTGSFIDPELATERVWAGDNLLATSLKGGPGNLFTVGALLFDENANPLLPGVDFGITPSNRTISITGDATYLFHLYSTWDDELGSIARIDAYERATQILRWNYRYQHPAASSIFDFKLISAHSSVYLIDPDSLSVSVGHEPRILQLSAETGELTGNPIQSRAPAKSRNFATLVTSNDQYLVLYENFDDKDTIHYIDPVSQDFVRSDTLDFLFNQFSPDYLFASNEAAYIGNSRAQRNIVRVAEGEPEINRTVNSLMPPQFYFHGDFFYYLNENILHRLRATDLSDESEFPLELPLSIFTPRLVGSGNSIMVTPNSEFHFFDLEPNQATLSLSNLSAFESEGEIQILAGIDRSSTTGVSFTLTTRDASARAGIDYLPPTDRNYFIPPGETSVTISIPLLIDSIPEFNEEIVLEVSNLSNALISEPVLRAKIIGSQFEVSEVIPTETPISAPPPNRVSIGWHQSNRSVTVQTPLPERDEWIIELPGIDLSVQIGASASGDLLAISTSARDDNDDPRLGSVNLYSISNRSLLHTFRDLSGQSNHQFGSTIRLHGDFLFIENGGDANLTSVYSATTYQLLFEAPGIHLSSITGRDDLLIFQVEGTRYVIAKEIDGEFQVIPIDPGESNIDLEKFNLFENASIGEDQVLLISLGPVFGGDVTVYAIDLSTGLLTKNFTLDRELSSMIRFDTEADIAHDGNFFYVTTATTLVIYDLETDALLMSVPHQLSSFGVSSPSLVIHGDRLEIIVNAEKSRSVYLSSLIPRIKLLTNTLSEEPGRSGVTALLSEPSQSEIEWEARITFPASLETLASSSDFSALEFISQVPRHRSIFSLNIPTVSDGNPEPTERFDLTLERNGIILSTSRFELFDYSRVRKLTPDILSDSPNPQLFGTAMAFNEEHAFFAMPGQLGLAHQKSIRFFRHSAPNILETLVEPDANENAIFGASIAANNHYLAISEVSDPLLVEAEGKVFIYHSHDFSPIGTLSGGEESSQFGLTMELAGDLLFIVDPALEDQPDKAGSVCVYKLPTLELLKTITAPTPQVDDRFGYDISINDNFFAISAPGTLEGEFTGGQVYLYSLETRALVREIRGADENFGFEFGEEIELGEDELVSSNSSGEIYIFNLEADSTPILLRNSESGSMRIEDDVIVVAEPSSLSPNQSERGSISFWSTSGTFIERIFGTDSQPSKFLFARHLGVHQGVVYVTTLDDAESDSPNAKVSRYLIPDLNPAGTFLENSLSNPASHDHFGDGVVNLLDFAFANVSSKVAPHLVSEGGQIFLPSPADIPSGIVLTLETSNDLNIWKQLFDLSVLAGDRFFQTDQSGQLWISPSQFTYDRFFRLAAKKPGGSDIR